MICNVVLGRLHPDADPAAVRSALDQILALPVGGCLAAQAGLDAGLRPGAWGFAITSDWVDVEAYQVYDADPEHNRIRAELLGPLCAEIARVQFEA